MLGPIVTAYSGGGIHPAGIAPRQRGGLYLFGAKSKAEPGGIHFMPYSLDEKYNPTNLKPPEPYSEKIGMLDGARWLNDNEMLMTDWTSGSLLLWTKGVGVRKLASGFEGPTDFCVSGHPLRKPERRVIVSDILKGEIRIMWFAMDAGASK